MEVASARNQWVLPIQQATLQAKNTVRAVPFKGSGDGRTEILVFTGNILVVVRRSYQKMYGVH